MKYETKDIELHISEEGFVRLEGLKMSDLKCAVIDTMSLHVAAQLVFLIVWQRLPVEMQIRDGKQEWWIMFVYS